MPSPGLHFEARRFSIPPPVAGKDRFDNEFFETLLDFDHDGRPDVVVAWSRTSAQGFATLQALHNDGGGTFIDATASVFPGGVPSLTGARNLVVADFDGDGLPDLFVADHGPDAAPFPGGQSHLFMGTKAGQLVDETQARLPSALAFTHDACAGDVNGDGASDIYLANQWPAGPPRLYLNDGVGHFRATTVGLPRGLVAGPPAYASCRLVDVDGDGDLDLVLGASQGGVVERDLLLLNDGHGGFTAAPADSMPPRLDPKGATIHIESADLDRDGRADLILSVHDEKFRNPRIQLLFNAGGGRFTDRSDLITLGPVPDFTWIVAARPADLDGTGWPGLVLGWAKGFGPPQVFQRPPLGSPVPTFERVGETFPTSGEALPADFDGDGRVDVLLNDGNGGYALLRNVTAR